MQFGVARLNTQNSELKNSERRTDSGRDARAPSSEAQGRDPALEREVG